MKRNRGRCYNREKNTLTVMEGEIFKEGVCKGFSQGTFWSRAAPVLEVAVLPEEEEGEGGLVSSLPPLGSTRGSVPQQPHGAGQAALASLLSFQPAEVPGCNCCLQLNS